MLPNNCLRGQADILVVQVSLSSTLKLQKHSTVQRLPCCFSSCALQRKTVQSGLCFIVHRLPCVACVASSPFLGFSLILDSCVIDPCAFTLYKNSLLLLWALQRLSAVFEMCKSLSRGGCGKWNSQSVQKLPISLFFLQVFICLLVKNCSKICRTHIESHSFFYAYSSKIANCAPHSLDASWILRVANDEVPAFWYNLEEESSEDQSFHSL